jgi:hypothetical protein
LHREGLRHGASFSENVNVHHSAFFCMVIGQRHCLSTLQHRAPVLCHPSTTSQCLWSLRQSYNRHALQRSHSHGCGITPENFHMHNLLAHHSQTPANMANHYSGQHGTTCCNTDTALPLPVCFSEESIQRQLGYFLTPRCAALKSLCQPVHTALVPALLYVPTYYVPIPTPRVISDPVNVHKRADSACAVDGSDTSCSVAAPEGQRAPWFGSATAQVLDTEKARTKTHPRRRDEWDCDFCGLGCFCEGLPG